MRVIAKPAFKNAARNPYTALLYNELVALGVEVVEFSMAGLQSSDWDIWHIHWPEGLLKRKTLWKTWRSARDSLALIDRLRKRGTKVVWTVHELQPHEQRHPRLEQRYWTELTRRLDGAIALTRTGLQQARQRFSALNAIPGFVIPHGHYRTVYPQTISRGAARQKLGLEPDATVVSFVGQIRPYKNVPLLIDAVRAIDDPRLVLLVCGNAPKSDFFAEVETAAAGDPRVRLFLRYIENDELQVFAKAADLLVFPYRDILNSGSALLGLSFDRPIVVPNLGAMAELQEAVGTGWVRSYDGAFSAAILRQAIGWARDEARGERAPTEAFDWPTIGAQTLDAYRSLIGGDHRSASQGCG